MGIERVIVFIGYPWSQDPSPDEFRRQNDQVLEAIDHSRAVRWVSFTSKHAGEIDELEQLASPRADGRRQAPEVAVHCHEACLDPIVPPRPPSLKPGASAYVVKAPELRAIDRRRVGLGHPGATLIAAAGGGDWELGIRVRSTANVVAEICGGDPALGGGEAGSASSVPSA